MITITDQLKVLENITFFFCNSQTCHLHNTPAMIVTLVAMIVTLVTMIDICIYIRMSYSWITIDRDYLFSLETQL